ncbi:hypothetical protein [Streptomyces olivaceiscleroticus]|uniref:Uncharacterized protein n=1 Tax=Streptomyces olivaceiscleroticus TaxID=68245 RepID=A0ABN0ZP45_9ACTN
MRKPAPAFTLQPLAPPKPSWWQAHRHQVLSTGALILGFYIGTHSPDAASQSTDQPHPDPAHTAPADSATSSAP